MNRNGPLLILHIFTAFALVSFSALLAAAQGDPDPNSPTPVLLSNTRSTRALAVEGTSARVDLRRIPDRSFDPNAYVTLFVTNLALMPDEGASAFRVYAWDGAGHEYRFPVVAFGGSIRRGVFAVTVRLTDEIGFWEPPTANGDLLVQLAWRGLGSNRVRLGLGQIGGGPPGHADAKPSRIRLSR